MLFVESVDKCRKFNRTDGLRFTVCPLVLQYSINYVIFWVPCPPPKTVCVTRKIYSTAKFCNMVYVATINFYPPAKPRGYLLILDIAGSDKIILKIEVET